MGNAACPVDEASSEQKLVGRCGAKGVRLAEMALPGGLIAVVIKDRNRIHMEGGSPVAVLHKQEHPVAGSSVPIHAARNDRIVGWRASVLREIGRTRIFIGRPDRIFRVSRIRPAITAQGIDGTIAGLRRARSRRAVVQVKHLLVKAVGCGSGTKDVVDIGQSLGLEFRAGYNYLRKAVRKYQTHTLRIKKEEQLILLDWAAQRTRPLMGDIGRARISWN